ncbi:MAG: MarR family winged helix-turn-helix transcriptional regulator [Aestuariivirga sp.]
MDLSQALPNRIRQGMDRVSTVLRADQWSAAQIVGLNPTQISVLGLLAGRGTNGVKVKDIAHHLGVSQPTATDSIAALERKSCVQKLASSDDARTTRVRISGGGRKLLKTVGLVTSATEKSIARLSTLEQADLLLLLVKLIRQLQLADAIPMQRMCVSCKHFRPYIHGGAVNPHHCAFVNAAFGNRDLRIDCDDHDTADPAIQAATWSAFTNGSDNLQATQPN